MMTDACKNEECINHCKGESGKYNDCLKYRDGYEGECTYFTSIVEMKEESMDELFNIIGKQDAIIRKLEKEINDMREGKYDLK